MRQTTEKIASELSLKAIRDTDKYDPLDIGYALTDDVYEQLCICADTHEKIFSEDEFFVILLIAGDPLLSNLMRFKYYAFMFLPQPRPQQTVFLYNRHTQKFKRLWSLPDAKTMAVISCMSYVAPQWRMTKAWCDSFYDHTFFEDIRAQYGIKHLAESEFLKANGKELSEPVSNDLSMDLPDSFDFSKCMSVSKPNHEVINS